MQRDHLYDLSAEQKVQRPIDSQNRPQPRLSRTGSAPRPSATCEVVSGKCFWSALLPFGDELRGARLKSEPDWRNFGLRNHARLDCFDRSARVIGSPYLRFS